MIYIPSDWLNDSANEKEIRSLLTEHQHDIKFNNSSTDIEKRLKELGEKKILEEYLKGTFAF